MTSAQISYGEDGYALTPQGQAWKLWFSGAEPATEADGDWFAGFNADARADEIFARIEADAERTDQENRGIPRTDSPARDQQGPYDRGPWRTWPLPAARDEPRTHPQAEPEAGA